MEWISLILCCELCSSVMIEKIKVGIFWIVMYKIFSGGISPPEKDFYELYWLVCAEVHLSRYCNESLLIEMIPLTSPREVIGQTLKCTRTYLYVAADHSFNNTCKNLRFSHNNGKTYTQNRAKRFQNRTLTFWVIAIIPNLELRIKIDVGKKRFE